MVIREPKDACMSYHGNMLADKGQMCTRACMPNMEQRWGNKSQPATPFWKELQTAWLAKSERALSHWPAGEEPQTANFSQWLWFWWVPQWVPPCLGQTQSWQWIILQWGMGGVMCSGHSVGSLTRGHPCDNGVTHSDVQHEGFCRSKGVYFRREIVLHARFLSHLFLGQHFDRIWEGFFSQCLSNFTIIHIKWKRDYLDFMMLPIGAFFLHFACLKPPDCDSPLSLLSHRSLKSPANHCTRFQKVSSSCTKPIVPRSHLLEGASLKINQVWRGSCVWLWS